MYAEGEEIIEGWFLDNFNEFAEQPIDEHYNAPVYVHSDVIDYIFGRRLPAEILSGASHKIAHKGCYKWVAKRVQYLQGGPHPATRDPWSLHEECSGK